MKLDFRAKLTMSQKRTTTMVVNAFFMLLTKKNFDDITVREICALSMIPHSTFYNYFEDKYDIIRWKFYSLIYEYYPEMDTVMNHYDNIERSGDLLYDFLESYKDIMRKIAKKNPQNGTFHQILKECMYEIGGIIAENCTRDKDFAIPYEIIFNNYINGFSSVLDETFYNDKSYTREQLRTFMREFYAK